jgi:vacuolar-type H+-ATPase subunit H
VGKTPSSINLSGSDRQVSTLAPKKYSYGQDMEAQGRARFPGAEDEGKRQEFMAGQQNQRSTRINELGKAAMGAVAKQNVAGTQAGARVQGAQITGDSRVQVADKNAGARVESAKVRSDKDIEVAKQKANAMLQQASIKARDNDTRNRIAQARLEINDPNAALRGGQTANPQDILKKYGLGTDQLAASPAPPSGQAAPAQSPAPKQQATSSPPPIAQRVAGQTKVTTSKGSFTWTGQGWKAD